MKLHLTLFLLLFGCLGSTAAQGQDLLDQGFLGQNLLENGDFDRDLRDWTLEEFGVATFFSDLDALDRTGSGAVELRVGELPIGLEGAIFSVCLPAAPGSTSIFAGAAVQGDADASVRLELFADPDCESPLVEFQEASLLADSPALFQFLLIDAVALPPVTTHLKIDLRTPSTQIGVAQNLFDKVFVTTGTPGDFPPLEVAASATTQSLQASLLATSSGGFSAFAPRFTWSFGDGTGALGPEAEHTYRQPGEYLVTLVADNGYETTQSELFLTVSEEMIPSIPTLQPPGLTLLLLLLALGGWRRISRS